MKILFKSKRKATVEARGLTQEYIFMKVLSTVYIPEKGYEVIVEYEYKNEENTISLGLITSSFSLEEASQLELDLMNVTNDELSLRLNNFIIAVSKYELARKPAFGLSGDEWELVI